MLNTTGRTDLESFFQKSGVLEYSKLKHTPFLAFVKNARDIDVHIVDNSQALLKLPKTTPVMCQWRGEWSSDYFHFTVGDVIDAIAIRAARPCTNFTAFGPCLLKYAHEGQHQFEDESQKPVVATDDLAKQIESLKAKRSHIVIVYTDHGLSEASYREELGRIDREIWAMRRLRRVEKAKDRL